MKRRDLIDFIFLAMLWGSSFLFMRVAAPEFGPIPLVEMRVAIAGLFLSAVLAVRGGFKNIRGMAAPLTVLAALNSAMPFPLFAYATLYVTAGFTAILNASAPLFGALVAYFWLRDKLTPSRVTGLIVGFAGVLVLVWGNISFKSGGTGWPVVAGLTASLCYGFAVNFTKKRFIGIDPIATAAGTQIAATGLLLPLAIIYWPAASPSLLSWFSAITLGVACTGIAYALFFRLIARIGPTKAIAVTYLIPVFGMLWGLIFLSEAITVNMIAGCAVILLGTALATGTLAFGPRPSVVAQPQVNPEEP